jgi:anti-anti-sigma factor
VAGELDLATTPQLEARIEQLRREGGAVILDLRNLLFIDSTGLRALLRARELCAERQCDFFLIPGPPGVQRLFELTGVLDVLTFLDP